MKRSRPKGRLFVSSFYITFENKPDYNSYVRVARDPLGVGCAVVKLRPPIEWAVFIRIGTSQLFMISSLIRASIKKTCNPLGPVP
jgi:hypothetical protein